MVNEVRYPDVHVVLTGEDGNAFFILGRIRKALRQANVDELTIGRFFDEATHGDYDHLLQTCMRWVSVE